MDDGTCAYHSWLDACEFLNEVRREWLQARREHNTPRVLQSVSYLVEAQAAELETRERMIQAAIEGTK